MTEVGFGRQTSRAYPSGGRWAAASFGFAFIYWMMCWLLLPTDFVAGMLLPWTIGAAARTPYWWIPSLAALVPLAVSLGLIFPFRLADRELQGWLILFIGAALLTSFASFAAMELSGLIG